MSTDGPGTKCRRKIAENYNRLSRVHERYRRQTTDRQTTDGRATAYFLPCFYFYFCICILYVAVCCSFYCIIFFFFYFLVFYCFIITLYLPFVANKRVHIANVNVSSRSLNCRYAGIAYPRKYCTVTRLQPHFNIY